MNSNSDSRAEAREWLLKFSDGQCPESQQQSFVRWLQHSEDNRRAFEEVQQFWSELDQVSAAVLADHGDIPQQRSGRHFALAASVLVTALFAALLWQWLGAGPARLPGAEPAYYSTRVSELRSLQLEDGSSITLGAQSRLVTRFSNERRLVSLEQGEAWFQVAPDKSRPFVVEAGSGSATAIGTAFSVHADRGRITVTVGEGVVAVRADNDDDAPRLSAGERVSVGSNGRLESVSQVPLQQIGSWRQGRRIFHNTPLQQVIGDLNRYSDKPVIITDPRLRGVLVSGVFDQFGDVRGVLRAVEQSLPAEVIERDGSISLRHQ